MIERLSDNHAGVTARRTALVVIAAVVTWQILSVNLSDFFVAQARDGEPERLQTALWWDQHHPAALAQLGANAIRQEQPGRRAAANGRGCPVLSRRQRSRR